VQNPTVIGNATLYLGDCLDILPSLGGVDAVVTDPPYGINAARDRNSEKWGWRDYPVTGWDVKRPDPAVFKAIFKCSANQVIWGGNYFSDMLPPSQKWLIWDKCQSEFSLADAELAWCSFDGAVRRINYPRSRALQDGKQHHTQKPVTVMEWCLDQLPKGVHSVLDPFMGSGTTGVACAKLGRKFIGIEIEPRYFDIACRRIEEAQKQADLFIAPAVSKAVQAPLFGPEAA
jgi:DNA modification methylase